MRQPADPVEQIKHSKTAVGDEDQRTLRQPARDQRDHLPGAFGQLLLLPLLARESRSDRHQTVRKGKPQTTPAQGTVTSNRQLSQRNPLALTKGE